MRNAFTIAIAGALMISAVTAATAQVSGSARAARAQAVPQPPPNVSTDPYGERPTDPNAGVPCSQRPFALGCDKRGFW